MARVAFSSSSSDDGIQQLLIQSFRSESSYCSHRDLNVSIDNAHFEYPPMPKATLPSLPALSASLVCYYTPSSPQVPAARNDLPVLLAMSASHSNTQPCLYKVDVSRKPHLDESNILALFPEALTADVEAIFADQTGSVRANATNEDVLSVSISLSLHLCENFVLRPP